MVNVLSPNQWFKSKNRNINLLNLDEDFIDYAYYTQLQYMESLKTRLFSVVAMYNEGGMEIGEKGYDELGFFGHTFTMRTWRSNIKVGDIVIIVGSNVPIEIRTKRDICLWECALNTRDPKEYLKITPGYPIVGIILSGLRGDDKYMNQEMLKYMAQ